METNNRDAKMGDSSRHHHSNMARSIPMVNYKQLQELTDEELEEMKTKMQEDLKLVNITIMTRQNTKVQK